MQITDHPGQIRARVTQALTDAGRAGDDVRVVAVSKQHSAESIRRLFASGITDFGESYLDEALPKLDELSGLDITWHFIGRIQANKTRAIAERFHWVHSLDRERVARRLDAQRPDHAEPLNVLIQVNLANEPQKGGVDPGQATDLAGCVADLPRLRLRGLMGIAPVAYSGQESLEYFATLRMLHDELRAAGHSLDTLSMGMSGDFQAAIAAGSNCVRIGTALFGPRSR
ncbi:MAG TPA: YggS family pyridoxal phosphate-dependent enzyme [Gammaproteobacteria bacterium]|nr:YggS family pyridoxal phosphate-dependent enzyme [Gammaproteobacteria bacterium]